MPDAIDQLVLRQARVFDPAADLDRIADVTITNGRIAAIGKARGKKGRQIDAEGCLLLPSLVDLRARLGQPGREYREDFRSGLKAAARGGYGAVCHLPSTHPVADNGVVIDSMLREAQSIAGAKLLPLGASTQKLKAAELAEFGELKARGVVALSDGDGPALRGQVLRRAMEYAKTFDMLLMQHPSAPELTQGALAHEGEIATRLGLKGSPAEAEAIALNEALNLVSLTGARFHASALSTKQSVRLVQQAKADGLPVTADVAIHNLVFTDAALSEFEANYRLEPPLRSNDHQEALWAGLREGIIDAVVSDHCPLSEPEKNHEFDQALPGALGLEFTLALLLERCPQRLSLEQLVRVTSLRPAQVLGLPAPSLAPGETANFTLVDPEQRWKPTKQPLLSKSRNTALLDTELVGAVRLTVVGGCFAYGSDG